MRPTEIERKTIMDKSSRIVVVVTVGVGGADNLADREATAPHWQSLFCEAI